MMRRLLAMGAGVLLAGSASAQLDDWFEGFKRSATSEQMYRFLYALPKGGDLHNHLTGAGLSEWWYELATDTQSNGGYEYYTKVRIDNCGGYGQNQFGPSPSLLLFVNLQESNWRALDSCRRGEYKRLSELNGREKAAWLDSIRLDKEWEGRDEFFQAHWQRLNDLIANPNITAGILLKNMQTFAAEGVVYIEFQSGVAGFVDPEGVPLPPETVANTYRRLLDSDEARQTGVTVKFQLSIVRFLPTAEQRLEQYYRFIDRHRDLYVGLNMVGREDNDKGYPLRFLATLRKLRRQLPGVKLAIHGGEVDEPNSHVRDTLLLGASRIGHGLNLITDPDTLLLMRNNDYLVEINLVSNLLLEYVGDYSEHPFPEYLRTGVPVALSTDDRGMWDSNLTDEYYTAVTEFNLSWQELTALGRNSLAHSFLPEADKRRLLEQYEQRLERFVRQIESRGTRALDTVQPVAYQHACRRFNLCNFDPRR